MFYDTIKLFVKTILYIELNGGAYNWLLKEEVPLNTKIIGL